MAVKSIFGFKIGKAEETTALPSFSPPVLDDGAVTITAAANYGISIDLDLNYKNEVELITRYRELAMQPEVESAVDDIINEAIVYSDNYSQVIDLNLEELEVSDKIKDAIDDEFKNILILLNFKNLGADIFRKYYVDGRLNYNILIDKDNLSKGIQELRYIDPRKLTKVREVNKTKDPVTGVDIVDGINEYYVYTESVLNKTNQNQTGLKIAPDSIISVTSGLMDSKRSVVLSYLHKAIKPMNMLRMIEDASVIYKVCLTGDTRVKTNSGWKYMKDVSAGDTVYSFYGHTGLKETKVKLQWKTGTKQTYKVNSKHHSIVGTDNHPILVLDKTTDIVEYIEIKDLVPKKHSLVYSKLENKDNNIKFPDVRNRAIKLINSEIFVNLDINNKEKYIEHLAEVYELKTSTMRNFLYGQQFLEKETAYQILEELNLSDSAEVSEKFEDMNYDTKYNIPEFIDAEFARLYGFLLGDGSISKNSIVFAEGVYPEQNEYYANILRKYFGNCSRCNSKTRQYVNYTTSNTLGAELFVKLGFTNGAKTKRIPSWLWECSDNIKKEFILGLIDADGWIKSNEYSNAWSAEIQLANKALIEDIKEIWTDIGLSSGHIRYKFSEGGRYISGNKTPLPDTESWILYISDIPLSKFEPILSISEENIEDVYDLEVESEKHNFVANGIVVHNSRAPERRIFYIDVGNLPKMKAEQYMKDVMTKYRNKVVYNSSTGEIQDDRKYLSMQEDFWMPRRDGKSTEITTLPSSAAFDDMSMVEYFEKKVYKALNVPYSRIHEPEQGFSIGRSQEISRDEVKFAKFINRLRNKFVDVFDQALRVQLILKGVCTLEEYEEYKNFFIYDWKQDNNYAELKDAELIGNRTQLLASVDPYLGKYFSLTWIQHKVLNMTEDEIKEIQKDIKKEIALGIYTDPKLNTEAETVQIQSSIQQAQQPLVQPEDSSNTSKDTEQNLQQNNNGNPYYNG